MANRGRAPTNNAPRQNEYFVPRDGIDREVITADICRYLGNDALVRPGTHTNDSGRVVQGYFITAYRNLTSAMIADLKNDSARWEAERRKSQSGAGTPVYSQRDRVDDRVHNPNSQAVRYQDSQIRDGPQRGGGGGGSGNIPLGGGGGGSAGGPPYGGMQPPYGGGGNGAYDNGPHYPGSESPGYTAAGLGGPGPGPYSPPAGHGYNGGPYAQGGLPPQAQYPPQQPSAQDPRYGGPPPQMGGMGGVMGGGYGAPINSAAHPQQQAQDGYASGAHYAVSNSRDMYAMDMQMTDAPMAPVRRNSPPGAGAFGLPRNGSGGSNTNGPYGGAPPAMVAGYGGYSAPPPVSHAVAYAPPIDGGYGRAPTSNTGFSPAHDMTPQPQQHAQQYEEPAPSRPPKPSSPARSGPVAANTLAQLPNSNSGQQPSGSRHPREQRAVSERSDHQMRDRPDRPVDRERERDVTPPNRTGSATKAGAAATHHHYGRR